MEFVNATRMVAGYTMVTEQSGRDLLLVVVKGTFKIPAEAGTTVRLHDEQVPLVMSDVFCGEPGLSAPLYEVDFSPRKQRCDVLLNGTAHAPGGRMSERVTVGLRIGSWSKIFDVVGDRVWTMSGGIRASAPTPFATMPISYERAFGGVDAHHEDPAEHVAFMANPCGRGFHKHLVGRWVDGSPLPNTEEIGVPVDQPGGAFRPMAFGALGRHWEARAHYAGTYDEDWMDNVFPFLPKDFDERYFQSAPPDQQLTIPMGLQPVSLLNLTPDGRREFVLPDFEAPIHVFPKKGEREDLTARADTIVIEPDLERLTITWRITRPLRRNLFEVEQVLVGRKGPEWWQQRADITFPIAVVLETTASDQADDEPAASPGDVDDADAVDAGDEADDADDGEAEPVEGDDT